VLLTTKGKGEGRGEEEREREDEEKKRHGMCEKKRDLVGNDIVRCFSVG
jgi:hypothetical protein